VEFVVVDYTSLPAITTALHSINTVICTFTMFTPESLEAQTNLIQAALKAGCTRFCPSEFGGKLNKIPSYALKANIIDLLDRTPELEYTAFSPGFFMDYFAVPFAVTHLAEFVAYVDAEMGEGIVGGSGDEKLVLTTARDTARFVVGACGLPRGSWPKFGGMVGERTSLNEIIALVEKLKGISWKRLIVREEVQYSSTYDQGD
jgi:NmrA-like family